MSPKLSGEEVIARVIREHYSLGEIGVPEPVPEAHQRRHRKLIVDTSRGRFLVKTYARDLEVLDALRFQHRLSDHLSKQGLPVARIARARGGKGIVEIDDWALELQKFVDGESMRVTASTLEIAATALGKFHEVCRDFPRPKREASIWRFSEVPRKSFADLYQQARRSGNTKALTDNCNAIALFLKDAAEALDENARGEFETGLIHGDWHGGNLLFRDEELVGILDLEFAGEGCFLEDLAYAISNLCIRTTDDTEILTKRTNKLLDHYQMCRSLSYAEEVALYYAVGVKHITTVCYQLQQFGGETAGHDASGWMNLLASQCAWLLERSKKARWRT